MKSLSENSRNFKFKFEHYFTGTPKTLLRLALILFCWEGANPIIFKVYVSIEIAHLRRRRSQDRSLKLNVWIKCENFLKVTLLFKLRHRQWISHRAIPPTFCGVTRGLNSSFINDCYSNVVCEHPCLLFDCARFKYRSWTCHWSLPFLPRKRYFRGL